MALTADMIAEALGWSVNARRGADQHDLMAEWKSGQLVGGAYAEGVNVSPVDGEPAFLVKIGPRYDMSVEPPTELEPTQTFKVYVEEV